MRAEAIALGFAGPAWEEGRDIWSGLNDYLAELGVELCSVTSVKASEAEVEEAVKQALRRSHLVIITGGAARGPLLARHGTEDLTKKILSRLLDRRLILQGDLIRKLEDAFKARGMDLPTAFEKMALLPSGARALEDVHGAPSGFYMEHAGRYILYLPWLPADPKDAAPGELIRLLTGRRRPRRFERVRIVRAYGLEEPKARELLKDATGGEASLEFTCSLEGVDIKVRARADTAGKAEKLLDDTSAEVMARLGDFCYGTGAEGIEAAVARLLTGKKLMIATAESCTGGLIAKRLTDVSGSSLYMERGVVTYSNRSKEELLGVPARLLQEHGAVSKETAQAMAEGVRWGAKVDLGLSVTGIAGPTGGTIAKPVGLVYIGLATPEGVTVKGFNFPGDRGTIRFAASQRALDMVRRYLIS